MGASDYEEQVRDYRQQKDAYFGDDPHSPIPDEERDSFAGLAYYSPDSDYRFVLPLHEHDEKETITVETTTDGERQYLRWGEFRFDVGGESATLQAYKASPDEDRLWVPFRDATSGEETYGAGRYLDLEPEQHRDGEWALDFNLAYNPTCAYNEAYECPLVPMENWLDVPIEAGEKAYQGPDTQ